MDKCPSCGHDEFYRLGRISGTVAIHQRYDGSQEYYDKHNNIRYVDNSGMYDHTQIKMQKTRFCSNCFKKLPKATTPLSELTK